MSAPHLPDDDLSTYLDAYDLDPEADAHLESCLRCQLRLDALAEAVELLMTLDVAPAEAREAAVERALAAADEPARVGGGRPPRWLGAVAAVVVLVLGVTVVTRLGDDDDNASMSTASGAGAVDGGDLGDLDAATLRTQVQGVVEPEQLQATAGAENGTAAGGGPGDGGGTGGGGDGDGTDDSPALEDSTSGPAAATRSNARGGRTASTAACERRVAAEYDKGLLGPLVYRATGSWQGTPAAVLTYRIAEARSELDHMVYVVSLADCTLLNVQTF